MHIRMENNIQITEVWEAIETIANNVKVSKAVKS